MQNSIESSYLHVKESSISLLNRLVVVTAIVLAAVSLVDIIYGRVLFPGEELYATFLPNDILNLVLSLPALLVCWRLVRNNRLAGLLCLPGVLFNVTYMAILNIIGLSLNFMFLPYILLLLLCVYSMIFIVAGIDGAAVRQRFSGSVSEKFAGGVLVFLGVFNLLYQSANAINAVLQQHAVPAGEFMLMVDDLAFNGPALLLGGILLLRRKSLGYVAAPGLLLQYALLAAGAIPAIIIHSFITGGSTGVVDIAVLLAMTALCIVPLLPFLRHAGLFTVSAGSE